VLIGFCSLVRCFAVLDIVPQTNPCYVYVTPYNNNNTGGQHEVFGVTAATSKTGNTPGMFCTQNLTLERSVFTHLI